MESHGRHQHNPLPALSLVRSRQRTSNMKMTMYHGLRNTEVEYFLRFSSSTMLLNLPIQEEEVMPPQVRVARPRMEPALQE